MITGKNYIGEELSSKGEVTFKTFDPKENKETAAIFYEATPDEVDAAVEKAAAAFKVYKQKSDADKAEFLEAIAEELEANAEALKQIYRVESGLPEGRSNGEFARTAGQLRAFAEMLKEGSWVEAIISNPEGKPDIRRMQVPFGPVAVFGASNFPFAFSTAGGDTASALASGSPVVVKSHPLHAGTGELVSEAIIKAAKRTGMPDGVFSNLNSKGIEVGEWLVKHPKIKAVGFTGSYKAGTALCKLAADRAEPIPVYAEMGSINPVLALPSALEEKADFWAEQYAGSITAGCGQFCTNPGLILGIESTDLNNFVEKLGKNLSNLAPSVMLSPGIQHQYEASKTEVLEQEGYSEVSKYNGDLQPNFGRQQVITVSGANFLQNKNFHKEVFGPFSVVVKCKDKTELGEVLEQLEGQLTGTVLNSEEKELSEFATIIDTLTDTVGRIIYNSVPTGVEVCAAMTHGGPFPATSNAKFTSVGLTAVQRWVRPVSFQDWPQALLPQALKDENSLGILRNINNKYTTDSL
ncbi:aldehyde dehydrogenase (NADP(+)) [Zunongwangia profunda]|jgi:NADP-dependent aldehyde dehydrogenase|uniref:Aldehyde dehydrogenase n=3 Tax=Zunongwangia profunda TaxID=398743 RepID=D5BK40_ZUNPS|nr:aldehyde dehydrogenase (NADP(+)) [Zunongwangia profunda]ADF51720.1 aldehyde dehydrogenase [Zunongwangia profunda SM-A87]MAS69997.1 aldehyde dehydrogenase (NADP(+)) [Zunongwangia sp.]MCC4229595.1 aldehyde dehydrogenase (NADP(+)) [Zunongwangia profunda]HCV79532.1 aldehyde dehydrogenase (NADP(+)) [Zunongwangia profunda]|tara:strand:- start:1597 stop:3165 length:1569 start_codon:yes stop_codon:yes gene_type:complete